ncbi:hypothetical protein ACFL6S_29355 [Candidatus Poribacteria bacterium]
MGRCLSIILTLMFLCAGSALADGKFIMITAGGGLNGNEQAISDFVTEMGFEVEVHSEGEPDPVDLTDASIVMVTESITSGNVAGGYNDVDTPVIANEAWIWDDMGFIADGAQSKTDIDTTIVIENPDHAITEGFAGDVEIAAQPVVFMSASAFEGGAQVLATVKSTGNATLVVYEAGAQTDKGKTPARRVAMFLFDNTPLALTEDGWTLVERSILWAIGEIGANQPVDPEGALAVTWGHLKAGI